MKKDVALVYMVAGMSNRFGGKIKAFAEVGPKGQKLLDISLKNALRADFSKIILIVSDATKDSFLSTYGKSAFGIPIEYSLQTYDKKFRNKPWGTVDAVVSAIEHLNDTPFVLCNGDDLYGSSEFKSLAENLRNHPDLNFAVGYNLGDVIPEIVDPKGVNRAVFSVNESSEPIKDVSGIVEHLGITRENLKERGLSLKSLCAVNFFGLQPQVIHHLNEIIKEFKLKNIENKDSECLLPSEIGNLIKSKKINMKLVHAKEKWYGITYPEDVEKVRDELKATYFI